MVDPAIWFGYRGRQVPEPEMALTDNDAYRATLDRLRNDLSQAEARVDKLKAGISAIEDLIEAPRSNGTHRLPDPWSLPTPVRVVATEKIRQLTLKNAAIAALDMAARPMRTRQIYDFLMKFEYPYHKPFETFKGSMTPILDREAEIFEKVSPGLYALRKWPSAQKALNAEVAPGLLDGIVATNGGTT
jgi:hypothetical protein